MGEQHLHELGLILVLGFWFQYQAHRCVLAGFITYRIQHRQDDLFQCHLFRRQSLLAQLDFGIGQFVNLFQHFL